MARARNTASVSDVSKCLKGELDCLDPSKYNGSVEQVIDCYVILIRSLLKLTARPVVTVLQHASQKAFPKETSDDCKKFAQAICNAVTHCRNKKKSMKTGSRLSPAVKTICKQLASLEETSRSPRRRQSRSSVETSPTAKRRSRVLKPNVSLSSCTSVSSPRIRKGGFASRSAKRRRVSAASSSPTSRALVLSTPAPGKSSPAVRAVSAVEVVDSSPEKPAKKKSSGKPMTFLDRSDLQMKKMRPDGEIEVASMRPGPDGFVIAQFQGEAEQVTEVPNFSYELKSGKTKKQPKKKPAAALKKPAAATAAEKPAEDPDEPLSTVAVVPAEEEPAAAAADSPPLQDRKIVSLHFVKATEKSYIQAKLENLSSKKKKLVVNLDKKKTANFVEIMERVMTRAESVLKLCKSTTFQELKETMVKYRDELVEEDAANDS